MNVILDAASYFVSVHFWNKTTFLFPTAGTGDSRCVI